MVKLFAKIRKNAKFVEPDVKTKEQIKEICDTVKNCS